MSWPDCLNFDNPYERIVKKFPNITKEDFDRLNFVDILNIDYRILSEGISRSNECVIEESIDTSNQDKVFVLPQNKYDTIKRNMYIGPIYKGIDTALYEFKKDKDIDKFLNDSRKLCIETVGSLKHPITSRALDYVSNAAMEEYGLDSTGEYSNPYYMIIKI